MRTLCLRQIGLLGVVIAATAGSGCSTMNNTETGAAAGGLVGAGAGAAIGAATGRPLLGAAIGAVTGTAGGALIGNSVDKQEQRDKDVAQAQALAAAQAQQQRIGVADVMAMSKQGMNDQLIINQIRTTRSTFQLTVSDLEMLKANGVSDRVIAEMQAARGAPVVVAGPAPVVYDSPVYAAPPPPVVVVQPRPYYRPYGYGYGGYYRGW